MPTIEHSQNEKESAGGKHFVRTLLLSLGFTALLFPASVRFCSAVSTVGQIQTPPPRDMKPPEDHQRYLAWLTKTGRSTEGKPHEPVTLRTGSWEFFFMEKSPGYFTDRVALDDAGRFITGSEDANWFAFLSTPGLDAKGALKRVAFLYRADDVQSAKEVSQQLRAKVTEPTLEGKSNGGIEFRGWLAFWRGEFPADMNHPQQITISATAESTFIVVESLK